MPKWEIRILVLLLFIALIPRVVDLGVFLTADEKNWVGRSYEFVRAFKDVRFNDMLQTTHPGVTALWLSGVAVTARILTTHTPFSFSNLGHFVVAAQLPVAITNAVLVLCVYWLMRELFRRPWVALVSSLVIALDPFIVGYSRVAHVDALLGGFMICAALACLLYAERGFSRRWLLVSAVFSALAVLTKAPGVFMMPYLGLVMLVYSGSQFWRREIFIQRLRDGVLWLLVVGILFVTIWPAVLWVPNPEGNVLVLKRDIGQAAVTPHDMTKDYALNSDFYIWTLLTRSTPPILFFAAVVVILLGWNMAGLSPKISALETRRMYMLLAFVFFFVVMMMLGAKKGDRYILPIFFVLDVLAVLGMWMLARLGARFLHKKSGRYGFLILSCLVVGCLGFTTYQYHPYAIAYSNPLFPDNLSQELGWGEGLDQVGAWLNEHAPDAVVASWYPEELGVYTSAHVAHINAHEQGKVRYIVVYRNMFGRAPDHYANDFIDLYYKKKDPVFVAYVAGKEFAWVFEKRVYERVVGELTSGFIVEQDVEIERSDAIGLDVLVATYSGRAVSGSLVVQLRDDAGALEHEWSVPVETIEDDAWLTLRTPEGEAISPGQYRVVLAGIGTAIDDAPTIRYTRERQYRDSNPIIDGQAVFGDLAIRIRYMLASGEEATEEDSRLLH